MLEDLQPRNSGSTILVASHRFLSEKVAPVSRKKITKLRELLHQQVEAAENAAARSQGQIPAAQVESLERLARLVSICDSEQPKTIRSRWPSVAILLGTLTVVSVLLYVRVSETEIELDAALSEVTFVLQQQQPLIPQVSLVTLGASGLREIQLPASRRHDAQVISSPDTESDISLSVRSDDKVRGTLNIALLTLPIGARVDVSSGEMSNQWQLSIERAEGELSATVNGYVRVGTSDSPPTELDFISPKLVLLRPGKAEVQLRMIPTVNPIVMSPQLLINSLSLRRIEQTANAQHTVVRRLSTVVSGTLYFEALNGQNLTLRPGEEIEFGQSRGEIRSLRLDGDHVVLSFQGRVRGMTLGSGDNRRSLMPTWLEWLKARHGLSLLWGTTFSVFGLIYGALRWWRP